MVRTLIWLLRITATLATLCLLLALAAIWYGYSEGALERAVAIAVARSDGRLQVDGAHGSALGPFSVARIAWKDGPLAIVAEDVQGRWSPRALLSRRLVIDEVTVSRLTVNMGESSSPAKPPIRWRFRCRSPLSGWPSEPSSSTPAAPSSKHLKSHSPTLVMTASTVCEACA